MNNRHDIVEVEGHTTSNARAWFDEGGQDAGTMFGCREEPISGVCAVSG